MSRQVSQFLQSREDKEADTVVIRPSATASLCIDSDDRYANYGVRRTNPTYPFKINIQKNEAILNGFFKRIALTEFRMNWTLPNISSAWGNNQIIMKWKSGSSVQTDLLITIPDGFYTASQMATAIQAEINETTSFKVQVADLTEDFFTFIPDPSLASVVTFYFTAVASPSTGFPNINTNVRQLIDMLNIPSFTTYQTSIISGIVNMRPTDYFDVVCSQLTYNQKLKDSSSAPITRDNMVRIYLDDTTKSQAFVQTNVYPFTATGTIVPTALVSQNTFNCLLTLSTTPSAILVGSRVSISGITGGAGWDGTASVLALDTLTPFGIQVSYDVAPIGTPVFSGSPLITYYNQTSYSLPITTWDDRVNGVTPFVLYRQFPYPKQIRWSKDMPIGNITFELYDDQGRSIQDLWNAVYPAGSVAGTQYANSFSWNCSLLISED